MGIISIGSNIAALRTLQQLGRNSSALEQSFERLSSGMRINRASDDAAGLAIALGLGKDSRVFGQALRNANDGISALNLASEALSGSNEILVRLKELATQAANGSLSQTQRLSIDQESQALTSEFNRQIGSVDFNGLKLLNGNFGRMNIQVGYGNNGTIGFDIGTELDRNLAAGYGGAVGKGVAGTSAGDPTLVDVNNDSRLDLVIADTADDEMNVLLGNGDGTFAARVAYSFTGVATNSSVSDLNGDGKVDLVSGDASNFYVRYGNGDGTFGAQSSISASGSVVSNTLVGDVNGDGIADLVGGASADTALLIRLGLGGGNFDSVVRISAGVNIRTAELSDLNSDGKLDIVVKDSTSGSLSTILSSGNGSFGSATTYAGLGTAGGLQIADIDYDGKTDIITSGSNLISILRGNGDGSFGAATTLTATSTGSALSVTDTDGDGVLDIAFLNSSIQIYKGNGDGSFKTLATYSSVTTTGTLIFGDLNGDGAKDAVARSTALFNVEMFFATPQSTTTLPRIDLTSRAAALTALGTIDAALNRVSGELGAIGATQSRIGSAINTLSAARENSLAAQSRITDTDVAAESASMTRQQILLQSASAVLAQANQLPSLALSLLRS